jgi:hypothetical protein
MEGISLQRDDFLPVIRNLRDVLIRIQPHGIAKADLSDRK